MSDPKAWARKLVAEYEAGNPARPGNVYRVAYAALGLKFPEGAPPGPKDVQKCSGAGPIAQPVAVPKRPPVDNPWWDTTDSSEEK